jgi:DNA-directed RNA polymerase subunit N (RpoN/RPB10)
MENVLFSIFSSSGKPGKSRFGQYATNRIREKEERVYRGLLRALSGNKGLCCRRDAMHRVSTIKKIIAIPQIPVVHLSSRKSRFKQ